MLCGLEAESDVCPGDQYDLAGEVFSHERYGACPLFAQELEEGSFSHGVSCVEGRNRGPGDSPFYTGPID